MRDIKIGNLDVPAGDYTLYVLPRSQGLATGGQQADRPVGNQSRRQHDAG